LKGICVFCGSSSGARLTYRQAAVALAALLVKRDIRLIYGGASVGLMGEIANAVIAGGGSVTGIIPRFMVGREVAHRNLSELRLVETMHERKALMAELAEGFIALPGGVGTLEELTEIFTWASLGLHAKPIGVLNVEGYFDSMLTFLDHAVAEGFLGSKRRALLLVDDQPQALLDRLLSSQPLADEGSPSGRIPIAGDGEQAGVIEIDVSQV